MKHTDHNLDIAIIGMAARLPGSDDIVNFWDNLKNGKESISTTAVGESENFVFKKGLINKPDNFDANFFNYSKEEAGLMDPQIRLMHEVIWATLENAGYGRGISNLSVGIYLGSKINQDWMEFCKRHSDKADDFELNKLWNKDYIASRIAYKLNMKGPALAIDTACSTSLVNVHLACRALLAGECDLALAGGSSVNLFKNGYHFKDGMVHSKDGRCRPFDASANGTVWSDGVGAVALKRYIDAKNDGDKILAVIKGSAVNNDGSEKNGFFAPGIEGQCRVIKDALKFSEVNPKTITYIEAHGTGTKIGDQIEIEALKEAFATEKKQYCAIGSVKANIGHTGAAAGIAGLIKTVLALQYKSIPPSINFKKPNQKIDFDHSPFFVADKIITWKRISPDIPLRAGVSSFGIGGTNAHVILEEAPKQEKGDKGKADQLIILSAKTETALKAMTDNLISHIEQNKNNINIADLAYTLQVGRGEFACRKVVVTKNNAKQAINDIKNKTKESYIPDNVKTIKQRNQATEKAHKLIEQGNYGLKQLSDLWLQGAKIDWQALYQGERRQRIPLPTYPFERQRYWPEETHVINQLKTIQFPQPAKNQDIKEWFYRPIWREEELKVMGGNRNRNSDSWLILSADNKLNQLFIKELGKVAIANPEEKINYGKLVKQTNPTRIIQVSTGGGMENLIRLAQELSKVYQPKEISITAITRNLQPVTKDDKVTNPEQSTILGPIKVIPQEYQNIKCRAIDIDRIDRITVKNITKDIEENATENQMAAYRNGKKYVQEFEKVSIERGQTAKKANRLKPHGTYLITGGLGTIGSSFAEYLARQAKANLILIGRSKIKNNHEKKAVLARIKKLTKAMYISANVANQKQMAEAVEIATKKFGHISGIIHAAGEVNPSMFANIQYWTKQSSDRQFLPKVSGVITLARIFEGQKLDFVILTSSISNILGGLGMASYVSANQYLDYFAQTQNNWRSINFDNWFKKDKKTPLSIDQFSIMPTEIPGLMEYLFGKELAKHNPLIVSTGDLQSRINLWTKPQIQMSATLHPRPDMAVKYQAPDSDIEQGIANIWQEVLGIKEIGVNDNFFEVGGNSLSIVQIASKMKSQLKTNIPVTKLFENPTIHLQARNIFKSSTPLVLAAPVLKIQDNIAIIGFSVRFPGSNNQFGYWDNLVKGKETITHAEKNSTNYVYSKGTIDNIEYFDAGFFGYSPKEAELMDPQMRLFHEICYEAMENAGVNSQSYFKSIGIYAGAGLNMSWLAKVSPLIDKDSAAAKFEAMELIDKDYLSTRVANKLNLKGPAITMDTGSSTSLVTIHSAIKALQQGECDLALAGGVKIANPNEQGYIYEPGTMNSPDGHCRVFDEKSEGTVWSDGLGVVVLKRLSDAMNDRDNILAVIKGSAINNDGSGKVSYSAPSVEGQAKVIRQAQQIAEVDPETITYIEAHGTGTKLGDPVEVEALTQAFNTKKRNYCAIGSVKSNIGHTSTAAGVASFIKTVLALEHKLIPPTINYSKPNTKINFKDSPFYVVTKPTEWKRIDKDIPLRAGVSSFGIGGTNAHVILEEAPQQEKGDPGKEDQLIILSAKTETALKTMTDNLISHIEQNKNNINIADLAYTLQVGRGEFACRKVVVTKNNAKQAINDIKNKTKESYIPDNVKTIKQRNQATEKAHKLIEQGNYDLKQLSDLWLQGAKIDWQALYQGEKRRRIPLPTYPFERQRYWPEEETRQPQLPEPAKDQNMADWFYCPAWEEKELIVNAKKEKKGTCLILSADAKLCQVGKKYQAVLAKPGKKYQKVNSREYIINPENKVDYDKLIAEVNPDRIIQDSGGMIGLIYLAQALGALDQVEDISITAITRNLQPVRRDDRVANPEQATILGPVKVIPQEYRNIRCRAIDIKEMDKSMAEAIIRETANNQDDLMVAYRQGKRYIQKFKKIEQDNTAKTKLKQNGTYLIIGGLGAIGGSLAEYLAKEFKANLILVGRSQISKDQEKQAKLKNFQKITQAIYLSADVANVKEMANAVKTAEAKFGRIDGVIHAAGEIDYGGIIMKRTREELEKTIASKVRGVQIIDKLIKPDFFLFCSSISAIKAPAGEVGYVAANNFLDSFAHYINTSTKQYAMSVDWNAWPEGGMFIRSKKAKEFNFVGFKREKIKHYLFDEYINDQKNNREIYISHFSPEKNWFLSEHKIAGKPAVPGALYLEMARAAAQKYSTNQDIILEDVYFPTPLLIKYKQTKTIIAIMKKNVSDYFDFTVLCHNPSSGYQEHIICKIKLNKRMAGQKFDIRKLKNEFVEVEDALKKKNNNKFVEFGPRWQSLKQVYAKGQSVLGFMEYPKKYAKELSVYKFHPAIIDSAVSILSKKIINTDENFLPLSYKTITIKRPLTGKMYSMIEQRNKYSETEKSMIYDAVLFNEAGEELIRIKEFISRKISKKGFNYESFSQKATENIISKQSIIIGAIVNGYFSSQSQLVQLSADYINSFPNNQFKEDSDLRLSEVSSSKPLPVNIEKELESIWHDVLGIEGIGLNDNFFEIGGNSLNVVSISNKIKSKLNVDIPVASLFQYTTIELLAKHIYGKNLGIQKSIVSNTNIHNISNDIAVIGYSAKYPKSGSVNAYWENLLKGRELLTALSDEELRSSGVSEEDLKKPNYVKLKGILDNIDMFAAKFFGYTPNEAIIMDPQIRLFHEVCYEALENAGYKSEQEHKTIGLYAGAAGAASFYNWSDIIKKALQDKSLDKNVIQSSLTNREHLSTLTAYKLQLKGPVFNVDTSSSTSLVAIHLASRALANNECDMALAGGACIWFPQKSGYESGTVEIWSDDGHTRPFDENSSGMLVSEGLGVVVLKRLSDAMNDGDNILAVIKGSAINNDGGNKASFSAPSVEGQAKVIKMAQQIAEVDPETITYIEAHGTGTKLGDPVEVEALTQAFNTDKKNYCGIGSAKSNMGHTDAAAGVAGLIKTVLALEHKLIPPTINYSKPNPKINFKDSPFYVVTKPTEWKRISPDIPLRAGVSSFGIGGTNAHVILEEAPQQEKGDPGKEDQLIILSTKTETALKAMTDNLISHIEKNKNNINIADLAYTLQVGRGEFACRKVVVTKNNAKQAIKDIKNKAKDNHISDNVSTVKQRNQATERAHKLIEQGNSDLKQLSDLWLQGAKIDWQALYQGENRRRIPLPTYPFERQRYWPARRESVKKNIKKGGSVLTEKKIDVEKELKKIWQEILGIKKISQKDDFFEIGGNSLNAMQVTALIKKNFGKSISMAQFYKNPTIKKIKTKLKNAKEYLPIKRISNKI